MIVPRNQALVDAGPPASLRGYSSKSVSNLTRDDTGSVTIVQQHFANEVDINTIMKRFGISRELPLGRAAAGVYGDFTGISDYESAVDAVERAHRGFMTLPPDVRERFGNDPAEVIRRAQSMDPADFMASFEPEAEVSPAPVAPAPVGDPAVGS